MKPAHIDRRYYQPLRSDAPAKPKEWKNKLLTLDTPFRKRSDAFNALIQKFAHSPFAVPNEDELSDLVCECVIHEEAGALTALLEQECVQTIRIASPAQTSALETLLKAMPASCAAKRLIFSGELGRKKASLLFRLMAHMPELECVKTDSGSVDFGTFIDPPSCSVLSKLKTLHVETTKNPYPFLYPILNASQLNGICLDSNPGMTDDDHHFFTLTLSSHASTLQQVKFRGLQAGESFGHYILLLKQLTRLSDLDLSLNALSSLHCKQLYKALNEKTTLIHLSLADCWPERLDKFDWLDLARLVSLPSLLSLDLSGNMATGRMMPVMMAIASHPGLQRLNFNVLDTEVQFVRDALSYLFENARTLAYLQLPGNWPDSSFKGLDEALETNHVLQALSIPSIESLRSKMPMKDFFEMYPNYSSLVNRIALNRGPLIESGMSAVLGGMTGHRVFPEIAGYAAAHMAIEGSDKDITALTLVDKKAHAESQAALKRLQKKK